MKKIAFCGLMLALALIASYVESLIPVPIPVPGIKLGVANSVVLILLYYTNAKTAWGISVGRVVLSGFLFGSLSSILYSLSGAILSLLVMTLIKKRDCFTMTGVSVAGGVSHNMGQLIMAFLVLESGALWYYLPVLLVSGCVTGGLIGILGKEIFKRMPREEAVGI
ncbi:MAG: Gx transporter family protein [Lachnospiraceae bacterium]|nr:Gx transporter family protein [Lachnospiraceae bacterium]